MDTDNVYRAELDTAGVLHVTGDLDDDAEQLLRQDLRTYTGDHALGLRVDLSAVTFLPSTALSVLLTSRVESEQLGSDLRFETTPASVAGRALTVCAIPYDVLLED